MSTSKCLSLRARIKTILADRGPLRSVDLAKSCGLTVSSLSYYLRDPDIVVQGGKPPRIVRLVTQAHVDTERKAMPVAGPSQVPLDTDATYALHQLAHEPRTLDDLVDLMDKSEKEVKAALRQLRRRHLLGPQRGEFYELTSTGLRRARAEGVIPAEVSRAG